MSDKPDWKDAPRWANWLAKDSTCAGNSWSWFEHEPERDETCWLQVADTRWRHAADSDKSSHDWVNTLEARP